MEERNDKEAAGRRRALGSFIRAMRGNRTQADFGKLLGGLSQATISAWENGLVDLTCEQVREVEVMLGITPGTLGITAGYVDAPVREPVSVSPDGRKSSSVADPVGRHFFSRPEDAIEAVEAADTLALGVRMWNVEVTTDADDEIYYRWCVEILADVPEEREQDGDEGEGE